jgi:CPA2 family monovalent cation:H+ antiporter-2
MNRGGGDDVAGRHAARGSAPATAMPPERHVIIVGFGLAGRAAVNNVIDQGVSYTVIERNPDVVNRCLPGGLNIIRGDAREPAVLRDAGIGRATDVAVTIPNDDVTLAVVEQARKLNATARIIARCTFVSGGMEAARLGADDTVIAEQVVAAEFGRVVLAALER